jgi:flavoprotein
VISFLLVDPFTHNAILIIPQAVADVVWTRSITTAYCGARSTYIVQFKFEAVCVLATITHTGKYAIATLASHYRL